MCLLPFGQRAALLPGADVAKLYGVSGHHHFLLAAGIAAIHLAVTQLCTKKKN